MPPKSEYTVPVKNRFGDLGSDSESDEPQKKRVETVAKPVEAKPRQKTVHVRANASRNPEEWTTGQIQKSFSGEDDAEIGGDKQREAARRRRLGQRGGRSEFKASGEYKETNRLDRRSGAGRGKEVKKPGRGGHKWGNTEADFGGEQSPKRSGTTSLEANSGEAGTSTPTSVEETSRTTQPAPVEEVVLNFADYQQDLKKKRAQLQQAQEQLLEGRETRQIDESQLDGCEKYQREETEEERVAREMHMIQRSEEREDENIDGRVKTYNLCEFTGSLMRRPGRKGDRRGPNDYSDKPQSKLAMEPRVPVNLDLKDAAAFPSLFA